MPVVQSLILQEKQEPVYNIEVEGDHCYRVGQQGLLVHNASVIRIPGSTIVWRTDIFPRARLMSIECSIPK